jgi:hypothetical protein
VYKEKTMETKLIPVVALGMFLTLVFGACNKTEPGAAGPSATPTEPQPFKPPPAKDASSDASGDASVAESPKPPPVEGKQAPSFIKKLGEMIKGVNLAVKENLPDCVKAIAAVNKFLLDHRADFDIIREESRAAMAKMSGEDKSKIGQMMMTEMADAISDWSQTQAAFRQQCAQEADKLAASLSALPLGN